jgi:transcriptional regulator with XRE-family HTH domain
MSSQTIRKTIGQRVKHYRQMNSLTQKELAAKIGTVSSSYITNIEAGQKGISLERIIELCEFFNIIVSDLIPIITQETENAVKLKEQTISETADLLRTLKANQVMMFKSMIAVVADNPCLE